MKREILYQIKEDLMKLIDNSVENDYDKERLLRTVKTYLDIHVEKDKERCKEVVKKKIKSR